MNHQRIIAQRMATIPLSLYIHFPWCLSKCPYCDFNSYTLSDENLIPAYVNKLSEDLKVEAAGQKGGELKSIYFGGGTPGLLPPGLVAKIIQEVSKYFTFAPKIEITLEANPGTIDLNLCREFKDAGINRISLGIQSFDDAKLKKIGRIHNVKVAFAAIDAVKSSRFINFNLDLMFGLPGQNIKGSLLDLETALSFKPPHLSWYQLTIDPKLAFKTGSWLLPQSEELWGIQQAGQVLLSQNGLKQYEVAAYCRSPADMCKHNVNYWQYGDYLGIGAGAHSKVTSTDYVVTRYWKIANPNVYLQSKDFIAGKETVTREKVPLEFMLNALRLYQPLKYKLFQCRTGFTIDTIKKQLQSAQKLGLIEVRKETIITTDRGKNFLDNLLEIFLV